MLNSQLRVETEKDQNYEQPTNNNNNEPSITDKVLSNEQTSEQSTLQQLESQAKPEESIITEQESAPLPTSNIVNEESKHEKQIISKESESQQPSTHAEQKEEHTPQDFPSVEIADETTDEFRRNSVRNAFLHAWRGYETYAWGHDEVRPLTNDVNNFGNMAATIVDSLDTMFIMGLKDELEKSKQFISTLSFDKDQWVSVFETTIRYVGGFLSIYDLTKDSVYLYKAQEIAEKLLPAFHKDTSFPHTEVNLQSGSFRNADWHRTTSILSEAGSIQLEFKYLSKHSGDRRFAQHAQKIMEVLDSQTKAYEGLYPSYLNTENGAFHGDHITLGALGDSFYEYLLKQYLMTGDEKFHRMYREFVRGLKKYLIKRSTPNKLVYIGEMRGGVVQTKFDHLVCFAGGMLALGSLESSNIGMNVTREELDEDMNLAKELTRTCYEIYKRQPTGIGCEIVNFSSETDDFSLQAPHYILRPEAIESIFILYRLTGDKMYKEWGWNIFQSIEKHCKTPIAYAGLKNVLIVDGVRDNAMESFFLSETLKYLYLLFTDDQIPLDKYVFTTEAHPLSRFDTQ
ncbi:predicted protein [Naegleria gruberi]|uniref:alpha-1,2-Mannosidase n=1 Tax=Naegleria gruberi TaxID=5762 RepID=D2VGN1_NAEGR|nr:uncharacterized protein NAEGRDRAFT_33949 [Naegleria gruberi]EFC44092.1 predicted protein [Naegleria gruberi]|eukprot:XP_002676836.1 predicted protein [Naegleria gruberi strain NEG-M]